MAWEPPTLVQDEGRGPAEVERCVCGRQVQAQMMMRVPPGLARRGETHICDGCRERLVRTGEVATRAEIVRHLGAPASVIARLEGAR